MSKSKKRQYLSSYWLDKGFKGTVKEKWKGGGIGWNLRISGVERTILDIYLMFPSPEIDIKLCTNYTKIHIYTIC